MPTPKQEYAAALRDIASRFGNLEADTIRRSVALLAAMRDRLQLQLTGAEGFEAFRLQELSANVDQLIAQYEAQMIALSRQTLVTSSRLGALSVVEPLQAAGVAVGFFQPTPAQINVLLDFSADLIRGIGQQARQAINTEIRLAALGERSTTSAMQAINRRLGVDTSDGIAYQGERILRTEMGRVYNVANQSQQQVTAQTVPGLQKMWVATGDRRTRISHLLAHGQIVAVNEPFRVGSVRMMYPLDPNAPAGEVINCRCRTVTIHPEIGPIGGPLDASVTRERNRRNG